MILQYTNPEDEHVQLSIACGSEPEARPGEAWLLSIYDESQDKEVCIEIEREFAQTVIDGLARYLERTAE